MAAAVQAVRQCFQTILVLPQRLRRSRQMGGRAGKEFLQSGHQLQPKRIAGRTGQIVAFIVPEGNVFLPEHGFQFRFGQCQQGAQHHSPAEGRPRRDPAQALSARAPQQVHQHGLGLIVPVMSRQQRVGGKLVHALGEQRPTLFPGQRFHARGVHIPRKPGLPDSEGYIPTDAEFFCQALIQPGAFAPKAVLHMARRQPKAAFVPKKGQPVQKCHAVAAAADRRQQQGVFLPQTRRLQRASQRRKQTFSHA